MASRSFSCGLNFDERADAIEAICDLRVQRMLDPKRTVLVEFGDALLRWHEILVRLIRGDAHEVADRLPSGPSLSFHDGNGSPDTGKSSARASAERERRAPDNAGSAAAVDTNARRLMLENGSLGVIGGPFEDEWLRPNANQTALSPLGSPGYDVVALPARRRPRRARALAPQSTAATYLRMRKSLRSVRSGPHPSHSCAARFGCPW